MMITVYSARRHALLALLLTIGLTACAEAPKPPPDEAYRQAVEEAKEGHNQEAKRLFEQVRDADTPVRLEFLAEIGIADSLYKDRKYEEAAAEYSHLFDIHSGDAIADYLKYQLGMCYYRRIDTIDRDQGLTRRARSEFTELVTRYPESDLVPAAQENLRLCNEYLAKRELYVGDFYFAKGNFRAAKNRYERGITAYGRVDSLPQLLHRLVLAEDALGETDAAQQTAARLANEYPDDPWNQNLHAALEEQRQRLAAEAQGDRLLNRMRHWWSEEDAATPAAPAETEPEGAAPAAAEPEAAPVKDTHTASPGPQSGGSPDPDLRSPVSDVAHDAGVATVDQSSRWQQLIEWLHGGAVAEAETLDTRRPAVAPVAASVAAAPESEPWPGSTVATVAAPPPAAPAPDSSRWQRLVTWLHGPAAAPAASPPPVAAPTTTTTPGLIVRHIPPVADEPTERLSVTPHAQPDRRVTASPAPVTPPPAAAVPPPVPVPPSEPAAETAPETLYAAAPRHEEMPPPVPAAAPAPAPVPEPLAETAAATVHAAARPPEAVQPAIVAPAPVPEPSAESAPVTSHAAAAPSPEEVPPPVVTVAQAPAAPASSTRPVMTDVPATGHGGLVVEEFPATDDGEETGLPAVQDAPATPATPAAAAPPPAAEATSPRPPLAERVDEAIAAAEGGSPPPSPPAVAARPVPRTTEVEPAAVSGQGTRNQPPRPLPLPAYARPTPPASGEAGLVPAAIAGRQTTAAPSVEWRSLTPAERPAPVGEPIGDVALPAIAPQSEPPAEPPPAPDFWQGLRDTYGRLAESEP
jgi:outer membrane protein assembly factor BamD